MTAGGAEDRLSQPQPLPMKGLCMKQKARAPRKKIAVEWTDETFGLPLERKPNTDTAAAPAPMGVTEFLRRHAVPPALATSPPEAASG